MNNDKKNKKSLIKFLFLGGFLLFLFKRKKDSREIDLKDLGYNFTDFLYKEEKEADRFIHHKEDLGDYVEGTGSIFRDYFIPHRGNNHHPKIFKKRFLFSILFLAFFIKAGIVSYLFFIYPNDAKMDEDIESGVLTLLNEERLFRGLNPLVLNQSLSDSARDRADDMILNNYFAHKSLDGKMPWDFVSKRDYPYLYIGENLGMNFSSADSVHKALMESPSHKKNILNQQYNDVGIIVKQGIIDGKETNILVELFGSVKKTEMVLNPSIVSEIVENLSQSKDDAVEVLAKEIEIASAVKEDSSFVPENREASSSPIYETDKEETEISSTSPLLLGDKARVYIEKEVLVADLEIGLSKDIVFVNNIDIKDKYSLATKVSDYFNFFLLGLLFLMTALLLINIFVRIEIQHKPVIIQAFLFLILLFGIYSTRLHFLENLPSYIAIY